MRNKDQLMQSANQARFQASPSHSLKSIPFYLSEASPIKEKQFRKQ